MAQYRKLPVVIEAVKFTYPPTDELRIFMGNSMGDTSKARHITAQGEMEIHTLEDGQYLKVAHIATEGDFIIKGVQGEFYACKPDIFHSTYEEV
jgi:hypothetical protein